jgi:glycosyltransferase involved in cell wall biosynthesis
VKVLIVINSLKTGGKERRMLELAKGLKELHSVNCLIFALNDEVLQKQVFEYGITLITCKKSITSRAKAIFTVIRICKEYNPDVINSWCSLSSLICIPAKIIYKKPLVNNQITSAHQEHKQVSVGRLVNRLNFCFSDLIIANSNAGLIVFKPPYRKSSFIHNGFDLTRTTKQRESIEEIKTRLGVKTRWLLTMIGSMKGKKDYDTFTKTAIYVCRSWPDVTFLGVGGGSYHHVFYNSVPDDLKDRILFPGERDDVDDIVYASDIGILATYSEGISNVLIEYMAFGKPVVTTRVGGTPELVRDGIDGLLVDPNSESDLSQKIEYLLSNEKIIKKMGNAGRERIYVNFNMVKQVSNYYMMFSQVLG